MSQSDEFTSVTTDRTPGAGVAGFGARVVNRLLSGIRYGSIRVVLPSGRTIEMAGPEKGPDAVIVIKRWRMLSRVLHAGDIGFAEGYLKQEWTTPDLTNVIRFAARNRHGLTLATHGGYLGRIAVRLSHLLNANTKRGSRRNIEAHYDLGNEFYAEWLDPSMFYSSALYEHQGQSLEDAQRQKLERIREKLAMSQGDSVLEIGCGWGALALDLAQNVNARVTGLTLSPSQLAFANERIRQAGVEGQIDLRLQDYRDTSGQFDRIVSIEMFEAVGEAYWPAYFDTIRRCLKPGGRAVLQVISINEDRFDSYRRNPDFIQKYVFPGGFLPSDSAFTAAVEKSGLVVSDIEHFGASYARTLAEWRTRFHAAWPKIAELGFDGRFRRLWDYYLCYCEAGFEEEAINVGFYTIEHA
ncbi:class I SAM-dependent methyltransferase [Rhizobium sp. CFBP 13726]|uniref:SAM-dependent methyltransferase n=1 Tax=Rhizobium sp. CFBP 13726 TaxID=2775296 RepID=UPI00177B2C91|nr:cyclopropane-fatty-acyl-phospholipid synthase family protein [Rhizobium sp. CFBP 13726]MBD8653509.1 class I SAM-dependent methyltransferase [Rhizobium sp. CFBP 13726]